MTVSPGFEESQQHRLVGLRARVRLHVRRLGAEDLPDAVDRELLGDVDVLATAVVALARITLGVLVGHLAALRRHHRRTRVVFRRDQLDVFFLPAVLELHGVPQLRVYLGDSEVSIEHGDSFDCVVRCVMDRGRDSNADQARASMSSSASDRCETSAQPSTA